MGGHSSVDMVDYSFTRTERHFTGTGHRGCSLRETVDHTVGACDRRGSNRGHVDRHTQRSIGVYHDVPNLDLDICRPGRDNPPKYGQKICVHRRAEGKNLGATKNQDSQPADLLAVLARPRERGLDSEAELAFFAYVSLRLHVTTQGSYNAPLRVRAPPHILLALHRRKLACG